MNVKEKDNEYIANTYARCPLVITGGKGSLVTDDAGKTYIDLSTGIAVNTFGVLTFFTHTRQFFLKRNLNDSVK